MEFATRLFLLCIYSVTVLETYGYQICKSTIFVLFLIIVKYNGAFHYNRYRQRP